MCAASPTTNTRPGRYASTMRWLIRNTEDHRRFRATVGSGASRSSTAWMWCSSGDREPSNPCAIPSAAPEPLARSSGTNIDMR